jgi:hypothetical protein
MSGWHPRGAKPTPGQHAKKPNILVIMGVSLIDCTGPSARHESFYSAGPHLGVIRLDDFKYLFLQQPNGRMGGR